MTITIPNNKQSQFSKVKVELGDLIVAFQDTAPRVTISEGER